MVEWWWCYVEKLTNDSDGDRTLGAVAVVANEGHEKVCSQT